MHLVGSNNKKNGNYIQLDLLDNNTDKKNYIMRVVKHNEYTSTTFFNNSKEINEYKKKLKKQGFVKFDPEQMRLNNI